MTVELALGQQVAPVPIRTAFSAAARVLGTIASLVGTRAMFISSIRDTITIAVDALAGLIFLGGGLVDGLLLRDYHQERADDLTRLRLLVSEAPIAIYGFKHSQTV
jgi:hypothetical protein